MANTDAVRTMFEAYELRSGERHRDAELITVGDGTLVETQGLPGGRV